MIQQEQEYRNISWTEIKLACDSTCYICNGTAATNCLTCYITGSNKYYINANKTCNPACPLIGYYPDTNNTCQSCDSTCYTCNGGFATNCLTCYTTGSNKYFMNVNSSCNPACPPIGYYTDTSYNCLSCDSTCYTCNGTAATNCLTCDTTGSNKYYISANKTCITSCPIGYYADANYTCNILSGYFLEEASGICLLCSNNCSTCNITNTNCLSCAAEGNSSYYLEINSTNTEYRYCKFNQSNFGLASLSDNSTVEVDVIFNKALDVSTLPTLDDIFNLTISDFKTTEFTYNVIESSETKLTIELRPQKTIQENILTLNFQNSISIYNYNHQLVTEIRNNIIQLRNYSVDDGGSTVVAAQATAKVVAVAVVAAIPSLIFSGMSGSIWKSLEIFQILYYYSLINVDIPINFENFLNCFAASISLSELFLILIILNVNHKKYFFD